jgi:hypothetical protein
MKRLLENMFVSIAIRRVAIRAVILRATASALIVALFLMADASSRATTAVLARNTNERSTTTSKSMQSTLTMQIRTVLVESFNRIGEVITLTNGSLLDRITNHGAKHLYNVAYRL